MMPPDEPDTNPGTPTAKAVAAEVTAQAIEIRHGGLRVMLPATLVIALATSLATSATVRYTAPTPTAIDTRDLVEIRDGVRELKKDVKSLTEAQSRLATDAANAKTLADIEKDSVRSRLSSIESRIR